MSEKLELDRWVFEEMVYLLSINGRLTVKEAFAFVNEHARIRQIPKKGLEPIGIVYVFFGYKQDATRYRVENNIDKKEMVVANDWRFLEGRRARPVVIDLDSEWSFRNWNHENHVRARQQVNILESYYGSAG